MFKKKKLFLSLLLIVTLIIFVNGVFAFSYTAPIEPDNKLLILGESSIVSCKDWVCSYNYSVTNNDSVSHLVNVVPYLNTLLREPIKVQEISLEQSPINYVGCIEYQDIPDDKNGEKIKTCTKTGDFVEYETREIILKDFSSVPTKIPSTDLSVNVNEFKGTVSPKTAIQQTINSGETRYFKVIFKPINKTGELVLTAKSDSNPLIKASLDPTYSAGNLFEDFTDGDYTNNPTWTSVGDAGRIISVTTATARSETQSLYLYKSGGESDAWATIDGNFDINYSVWIFVENNASNYQGIAIAKSTLASIAQLYTKTSNWTYYDGSEHSLGISPDNNTWYRLEFQYTDSAATAKYAVYDYNNNLLVAVSQNVQSAGVVDKIHLNNQAGGKAYFDLITGNYTHSYSGPPLSANKITYNIYRRGTATHLNTIRMDCNNAAYNLTNQTSPFDYNYPTGTSLLCSFARPGYDDSNSNAVYADSNKTLTFYLNDSNAPGVGQTSSAGFTISTTYIKGDGNIFAFAYDSGSGLASCDYNSTSASYAVADLNATHCYKNGLSIVNASTYSFNLRATDNNGNIGYGTPTITYTGDTLAGTTTLTSDENQETGYIQISLSCADAGVGCKLITYKVDSGDWNYFTGTTTSFPLLGTGGTHTIQYYSTDKLDTNETLKSTDVNGFYLYTIFYPKNEETLIQIAEKWKLTLVNVGVASYVFTDLNVDKNVYLQMGSVNYLTVEDMNGNYFDRSYTIMPVADGNLQPYLVLVADGLLTTINVKNANTSFPIQGITIKIYKDIPGIGSTLVEQVISDSKGQALILLVLGGDYNFGVYNGLTLLKTYQITASSNTIYIYLDIGGTDINFVYTGYTTIFTPTSTGLQKTIIGNATFTQTIFNLGEVSTTYVSTIIQNGSVLSTQTLTSSDANEVFTRTVAWTDINIGTLTSRVTATSGGITRTYIQNYVINDSFGSNYNILTDGLQSGLRSDAGCSATGLCYPLLVIAIIISIVLVIAAALMLGQFQTQASGMIFVASIVLFTYLTWIPIELTAVVVLIMLAFIVNERRN